MLGFGVDGAVEQVITDVLGPGTEGPLDLVPTDVLGFGVENELTYLVSSMGTLGTSGSTGQPTAAGSDDSITNEDGSSILNDTKQLLATVSSIDATSTGSTVLYTVPSGKRVMVTDVIVSVDSATSVTNPITAGVGIAAGEDDIIASTELTNLLVADQTYTLDAFGQSRIARPGDVISFGIDAAITGTAQSLSVYLFGVQYSLPQLPTANLLTDFYPEASETVDQASGETITHVTFEIGPPSFATGLGGLKYMHDGAVAANLPSSGDQGGISVYHLVNITSSAIAGKFGGMGTPGGTVGGGSSFGVCDTQQTVGRVLTGTGTESSSPTTVTIASPAMPDENKLVISQHYTPGGGSTATLEIRFAGNVDSVTSGTLGQNSAQWTHVVTGAGVTLNFDPDNKIEGVQFYRTVSYADSNYNADVARALNALLP